MTTRFKNAIDALVYAFFNDTLAKGTCAACAVSNIVAHAHGKRVDNVMSTVYIGQDDNGIHVDNSDWRWSFKTVGGHQRIDEGGFETATFIKCTGVTGYSGMELARIEYAFETNTQIYFTEYFLHSKEAIMEDQYKGLCAVVDILCEIEGIQDPTEYKELFAYA